MMNETKETEMSVLGKIFSFVGNMLRNYQPIGPYQTYSGGSQYVSNMVQVQVLDDTGLWRTQTTVANDSQMYLPRVSDIQWRYPTSRVRVVDGNNRIVDVF